MITVNNVSKIYGVKDAQCLALDSVSLNIKKGKFVSVVGRSGSGKTTLMNMIGGLDSPTEGSVSVLDCEISGLSRDELADFRCKTVGFIFQSFYLDGAFSVYDNVALPLIIAGEKRAVIDERVNELLLRFGLSHLKKKRASNLSGGERQRVCIARALANDPPLILADEPTGNLDFENGRVVLDYLRELTKDGRTVILVTHNVEDAYKYSDEIITMKDGGVEKHEIL